MQEVAKIYSIRAHQEFVVVASSKKLLVLRCKKAEECQCQWKLRAMVVKDTSLFVIKKYTGPHTCVNPCLNRDHHQLDSKLVAAHIQAIIKAQFTLSPAAIQAIVMEKWGYEISYKKSLDGKHKAFRNLFGDFSQSYTDLPCLFLGIEQANPGCVVIWKTISHGVPNNETFQRVFWAFKPSPSILPQTYTSVPYPVSTEPASIALDIPLSSHHLPSHTLHPTDDTIIDLLPEWGRLPGRRPRTRRVHRLLHPSDTSAPSAPSPPSSPLSPSQTPQDPIGQQAVYFRRRPKRNIKAPSCGTH